MSVKNDEVECHACARPDIPKKGHTDKLSSSANDKSPKLSHQNPGQLPCSVHQQGGEESYALPVITSGIINKWPAHDATKRRDLLRPTTAMFESTNSRNMQAEGDSPRSIVDKAIYPENDKSLATTTTLKNKEPTIITVMGIFPALTGVKKRLDMYENRKAVKSILHV